MEKKCLEGKIRGNCGYYIGGSAPPDVLIETALFPEFQRYTKLGILRLFSSRIGFAHGEGGEKVGVNYVIVPVNDDALNTCSEIACEKNVDEIDLLRKKTERKGFELKLRKSLSRSMK